MDHPLEAKHYILAGIFIFFHAYVPLKSWRSRGTLAKLAILPARRRHFASTIFTQAFMLFLSLVVAYAFGFRLLPAVMPRMSDLLLGLAATAALVVFMLPRWEAAVRKGDRRLYFFMPQGAREKAWWVAVSLAAGFCEEITYRGVLYLLFTLLTGNAWAGALLSALLFAGGHAFQSRRSMIIIFFFALVFQGLAFQSGSLYVPMLAHAIYDVVAGFTYSRLGRKLGFVAEGDTAAVIATPGATRAPTT